MVNSKNRTNTRTVEQTLVNVSSQSVNVNCPPPTPGLRLPALAPPRARDRVARHSLRPARALERPSRASVLFEKVARLQTDAKQRVLRPLRDVLGRVALRLAGDQADERLLHYPTLRDAVSVDAEEAHAAIRPQVPADCRLDAGLDEPDDEVTSKGLALGPKEGQVALHR